MKTLKFIVESICELTLACFGAAMFYALLFLCGSGYYDVAGAIVFGGLAIWTMFEMKGLMEKKYGKL